MVSVPFFGQVIDEWPPGLAWPSRTRAVAVPPSWPANHISSTLLTFGNHGISTGFPVSMTTIVFGLAAETALIRFVLAADSCVGPEIVVPAMSGFGVADVAPTPSLTNTIAAFLPAAAVAASSMSPCARVSAKRKLAGTQAAGTGATAGGF